MATNDTTKAAPAKAAAKAADPKPDPPAPTVESEAVDEQPRVSTCAVNDGRGFHVGNAVNGVVCSYHAMHYDSAGNPR